MEIPAVLWGLPFILACFIWPRGIGTTLVWIAGLAFVGLILFGLGNIVVAAFGGSVFALLLLMWIFGAFK